MRIKPFKATVLNSAYWNMDKDISNQTFYFITYVDGKFCVDTLKESLKYVVKEVPFIACRLVNGFWRDKWVAVDNFSTDHLVRTINIDTTTEESFYEEAYSRFLKMKDKRLNLEVEPPFKILVFQSKATQNKVVVFCSHHSLSDPRGSGYFIRRIGEHYNALQKGTATELKKNCYTLPKLIFSYGVLNSFRELINTPKIDINSFYRMMDMDYHPENRNSEETIERLIIGKEELGRLKTFCKEYGLTLDGLVMLYALRIIRKYNERLEVPCSKACLSVGIDLRKHIKGDVLKISNYAGRDYYPVEISDADNISKFAKDLKDFKEKQQGIGSVMPFVILSILPIAMQKKMWRSSFGTALREWTLRTIVTTNMGRLDEFVIPFGDCVKDVSIVMASAYCGLPLISASGFKDSMTVYFTKFNDKDRLCQKVKSDFNALLQEVVCESRIMN
ncbi:MAG: condensation domain-containing protein [Clostridia bacterium]|nr:condensation domain-containing protein [Clostridia bacterium]